MFSRIKNTFLVCMMLIAFCLALQTYAIFIDIDFLIDIVKNMTLQKGLKNSLVVKLEGAQEAIESEQQDVAINKLNAFINEVEAQSGKKLTEQQASSLVRNANCIIEFLSR